MLGKKSGVTLLVSSQTAVKGGRGFEIGVKMDNLRGGDWGEIQNNTHRFEVCTRDQACFRLFLCVSYRQHRNTNLKRVH